MNMATPIFARRILLAALICAATTSSSSSSSSAAAYLRTSTIPPQTLAFSHLANSPLKPRLKFQSKSTPKMAENDNQEPVRRKANVRLSSPPSTSNNNYNNMYTANQLSPLDALLLNLTSDRTSLLLGSIGILILFINRLISFPDAYDANGQLDASFSIWEASRSRIDLLGVFAAGSVLLNGITKLDVTSVEAERVVLQGVLEEGVYWNEEELSKCNNNNNHNFQSTVEWALNSFLKCSPARTAVLLTTTTNADGTSNWKPLALAGVLPTETIQRTSIPSTMTSSTPILDRMLSERQGSIKGGTVAGSTIATNSKKQRGNESYLPTLQALPGRVEFTYLPGNAQEALVLPVLASSLTKFTQDGSDEKRQFAIVLGGDKAKSFSPRDIAWCREIASWIGDASSSK